MAERVDSLSRIGEDSRGNEWAGASTTGSLRTRVKDPESQLRGLGWEGSQSLGGSSLPVTGPGERGKRRGRATKGWGLPRASGEPKPP